MATPQEKLKIARKLARAEVLTYLSGTLVSNTFNSGFNAGLREAAKSIGIDVFPIESDAGNWARESCPGLGRECVPGCHACSQWAEKYVARL